MNIEPVIIKHNEEGWHIYIRDYPGVSGKGETEEIAIKAMLSQMEVWAKESPDDFEDWFDEAEPLMQDQIKAPETPVQESIPVPIQETITPPVQEAAREFHE